VRRVDNIAADASKLGFGANNAPKLLPVTVPATNSNSSNFAPNGRDTRRAVQAWQLLHRHDTSHRTTIRGLIFVNIKEFLTFVNIRCRISETYTELLQSVTLYCTDNFRNYWPYLVVLVQNICLKCLK